MSDQNNLAAGLQVSNSDDDTASRGASTSRATQDTENDFETADLTPVVAPVSATSPSVHSNVGPVPQSVALMGALSGRPAFAIVTADDRAANEDHPQVAGWQPGYRGMPSWLTSLIFHLSIILILALISVSDGGKQIVELLATASERVEMDEYESFDVALDPVEIETLDEQIETPTSKLMEATDLAPILDSSMLMSSMESERDSNLFEKISSTGIEKSDLPRRANGDGAKFFGVEGQGTDFVFIVDCSGSMADYGRWGQALRELKSSIQGLKKDQRFLVLLYNDGFIAMNSDIKLVKSTKREQDKAIKWLNRKRPDSWTFCAEALEKALSLQPDAVFLLSDGEFNDRAEVFFVLDSMNGKARLKRYERQQIPVHTVALGSHQGRFTMKRIADENSGLFKLVE